MKTIYVTKGRRIDDRMASMLADGDDYEIVYENVNATRRDKIRNVLECNVLVLWYDSIDSLSETQRMVARQIGARVESPWSHYSIVNMIEYISSLYGCTYNDVKSPSRNREFCMVRYAYVKVMNSHGFDIKMIGKYINRDRTTMYHYINNVSMTMTEKKKFDEVVKSADELFFGHK